MLGNKEGLMSKDEFKVLWKLGSSKLPIPAIFKPAADLIIPGWLDGLDNKVGDRVPEPWQSHLENLSTVVVKALEDKVISEQEAEEIAGFTAKILDEKIDVPMLADDVEALMFLELSRVVATMLYATFNKPKKE